MMNHEEKYNNNSHSLVDQDDQDIPPFLALRGDLVDQHRGHLGMAVSV